MNIEKYFNPKRFVNYLKYDLSLNYKSNLFLLLGMISGMFGICVLLIQTVDKTITINKYISFLSFAFIIYAVLFSGQTFKSLQEKKKITQFIMLPVSVFEKLIAEFILKIGVYIILFIPLFWGVFKITIPFCNYFFRTDKPQLIMGNYGILSFFDKPLINSFDNDTAILSILSSILFLFAGASYFKKSALIKSILSLGLVTGFSTLIMVVFSHLFLDLPEGEWFYKGSPDVNNSILVQVSKIVESLFYILITYYNLKEKTV